MSIISPDFERQLLKLLREGKRLEAIKQFRETTEQSLKASKEFVDNLAVRHGIVTPKTGACFVATACYGNYDAPEVVVLRRFRDNYLLQRHWGKLFVKFYYRVSPPMARFIASHHGTGIWIRNRILNPIVQYLSKAK